MRRFERFFPGFTNSHTTGPATRVVFVECVGGGGAGGGVTGRNSTGGGGAGGMYANKLDIVDGSTTYSSLAGGGGRSFTVYPVNGSDTSWRGDVCVAKGGLAAPVVSANNAAGAGAPGPTTGGIGDVVMPGGSGADAPSSSLSGGGGGGAGGGGGGGDASGATGGTGVDPGGNGGDGTNTVTMRYSGIALGGGGGGAITNSPTDVAAGSGANGGLIIWEFDPRDLLGLGCG
jgi:trimeric autotransporter adhesin